MIKKIEKKKDYNENKMKEYKDCCEECGDRVYRESPILINLRVSSGERLRGGIVPKTCECVKCYCVSCWLKKFKNKHCKPKCPYKDCQKEYKIEKWNSTDEEHRWVEMPDGTMALRLWD